MARRRNRKTRRYRRKKAPQRSRNLVIVKGPSYMPDRVRTKLVYTDVIYQTGSSLVDWVYRGNSIYDPYAGVGGDSVAGYTEIATLYNRYQVYGSSIKVEIANQDARGLLLAVTPLIKSTAFADYQDASGQPYAKAGLLPEQGGPAKIVRSYQSTKSIRGEAGVGDDELEALINADPAKQWYWHVFTATPDLSANLLYSMTISLTYYVDLFKRVEIQQV